MSVYRTIGPLVLIFAQNIDCGYTLELPHRAKIRKIGMPLYNPVLLYKRGGIYYTDMLS